MDLINKTWGYEEIIVNNPLYCGKFLTLFPNEHASSIHYHRVKTETFYVLDGIVELQVFEKIVEPVEKIPKLVNRLKLKTGDILTIDPYTPHRFWTIGHTAKFLEISTQSKDDDSIRIVVAGVAPKD